MAGGARGVEQYGAIYGPSRGVEQYGVIYGPWQLRAVQVQEAKKNFALRAKNTPPNFFSSLCGDFRRGPSPIGSAGRGVRRAWDLATCHGAALDLAPAVLLSPSSRRKTNKGDPKQATKESKEKKGKESNAKESKRKERKGKHRAQSTEQLAAMHRRSSHPPSCCCRSEEQGKSTGNKEAKKGKESTKDRQDTEQRRTARCDAPAVLTSRPPAAAARCASMEREAGLAGRQRQERQEQTRARDGQERKESKERKGKERKKTNEQAGGSSAAVRWRELTGDPPPSFPPLYSLATDLSLNESPHDRSYTYN